MSLTSEQEQVVRELREAMSELNHALSCKGRDAVSERLDDAFTKMESLFYEDQKLREWVSQTQSALEQAQRERDEALALISNDTSEVVLTEVDELRAALQDALNLFDEADKASDSKSTVCTAERREAWVKALAVRSEQAIKVRKLIKQRDELQAKLVVMESALKEAKRDADQMVSQVKVSNDAANLFRNKLLASEAAGAEMREALICFVDSCDTNSDNYIGGIPRLKVESALSTTCGTALLAERERHVKALEEISDENKCWSAPRAAAIAREALKEK